MKKKKKSTYSPNRLYAVIEKEAKIFHFWAIRSNKDECYE